VNHKEFLDRLSAVNGTPVEELSKQIESIPVALADLLKADEDLAIPGFGTFEVHKRLERVVENAATGRRTLTPPRLLMRFNPNLPTQPKYTLHDMAVQVAKKPKTRMLCLSWSSLLTNRLPDL